jgi:hypothetical protein
VRKEEKRVEIALPMLITNGLAGIKLGGDRGYRCRFFVRSAGEPAGQLGPIIIRQLHEGNEVGRITWLLKPGQVRDVSHDRS